MEIPPISFLKAAHAAAHRMSAKGKEKGLNPYPWILCLRRRGSTPYRMEKKSGMPMQRHAEVPAIRDGKRIGFMRMIGEKRAREMIPPEMTTMEHPMEAFKNLSRQGAQPNNAYSIKILPGD